MSGKKLNIDRNEYDELLNDVIEHADKQTHVSQESVEFETPESDLSPDSFRQVTSSGNKSALAKVLVVLCVLCIGMYGVNLSFSGNQDTLSPEAAEKELQQVYGADYNTVREFNLFVEDNSREFGPRLSTLNKSLSEAGDERPEFLEDHFYLFGDTLVYTEPSEIDTGSGR